MPDPSAHPPPDAASEIASELLIRTLVRLGIPTGRLLEIGCGRASLTTRLAEALPHARITALADDHADLAAAAAACRRFGPRVALTHLDPASPGLPVGPFDAALLRLRPAACSAAGSVLIEHAANAATFVVLLADEDVPEPDGEGRRSTEAACDDLGRIGLRCAVHGPDDRAEPGGPRLVVAWGGRPQGATPDRDEPEPGILVAAEALSFSLLAGPREWFAPDADLAGRLLQRLADAWLPAPFSPGIEGTSGAEVSAAGTPRADEDPPQRDLAAAIATAVPSGSVVAVVSDGDAVPPNGVQTMWPFPRDHSGAPLGLSPNDDAAAIALLDAVRADGAEYLLLPRSAFWWFERYRGFAAHVVRRFRSVAPDEGEYFVFDLRPGEAIGDGRSRRRPRT